MPNEPRPTDRMQCWSCHQFISPLKIVYYSISTPIIHCYLCNAELDYDKMSKRYLELERQAILDHAGVALWNQHG